MQIVSSEAAVYPDVLVMPEDPSGEYDYQVTEPTTQPLPTAVEEVAPIVKEATPVPTVEVVPSPSVVSVPPKAAPIRLEIPEANIDTSVSLQPLSESERQVRYLKPPNDPTAYWSDLFDQPGSNSTDLTYISGHGCDGLAICNEMDWPFNRLSDPNLVKQGTAVVITTENGKVCYVVDGPITTYPKESLKKQATVFGSAPLPERLVLVSCYTGSIHDRNVVAIASRVSCGG
jgi:hypothetical protein